MRRWRNWTLHRFRGETWHLTCEGCGREFFGREARMLARMGEHSCKACI
jgi:hypothetical protein